MFQSTKGLLTRLRSVNNEFQNVKYINMIQLLQMLQQRKLDKNLSFVYYFSSLMYNDSHHI
jgi:hypothetical protein